MRTILFTGSRTVRDHDAVALIIDGLVCNGLIRAIHGAARGVDHLVGLYLTANHPGIEQIAVPAAWEHCGPECPPTTSHRRTRQVPGMTLAFEEGAEAQPVLHEQSYCPTAGHRRNQLMLDEHAPDLVIAVVDKPLHLSRGTADMVRRAQKAHVPTYLFDLTGGKP